MSQPNLPPQPLLATAGTVFFPFLRALAHEINSPLTGVLGYSQLLAETLPEDSPDRADLEEILRCAEQCRELVQVLGRFSRLEAQDSITPWRELLSDLETVAGAVARKHGVDLVTEVRGEPPTAVCGNPWALRSALLALCGAVLGGCRARERATLVFERTSEGVLVSFGFTEGQPLPLGEPHPGKLASLDQARVLLASQGVELAWKRDDGQTTASGLLRIPD